MGLLTLALFGLAKAGTAPLLRGGARANTTEYSAGHANSTAADVDQSDVEELNLSASAEVSFAGCCLYCPTRFCSPYSGRCYIAFFRLYYAVCRPAWYQYGGYRPGFAVVAFGSADANNTGNVSGTVNLTASGTDIEPPSLPASAESAPATHTLSGNPRTEDAQILP